MGSPDIQSRHCIVDRSVAARDRPVRVELHVHDPRSPLDEDTGADARPIGLRVTDLWLAPATPALGLGQHLDTCAPAPPSPVLWEGWSSPELEGTWTDGSEAVIRLPAVDMPAEAVELVLDFSQVHVDGTNHPRGVEITVDGAPTLCWWFTAPGEQSRSLTLPVAAIPTIVVLSLPWTVSPRSLGISDDQRRLGLKLRALRILELRPPAAEIAPRRASKRWKRT